MHALHSRMAHCPNSVNINVKAWEESRIFVQAVQEMLITAVFEP